VKLDLKGLTTETLEQEVLDAARRAFDFERSDEKLKTISRTFGENLTAEEEQSRQVIQENIAIRNVIQHNHGVVRQEDLKRAGVKSFTIDHGDRMETAGIGQRVTRTAFDLEIFANALKTVATALSP